MHVVFLDRDTFSPEIRFPHEALKDCRWSEYPATAPAQVLERCSAASAVVVNKVKLPGSVLAQLPQLKLIAVSATGVDNVDIEAARERGIGVCNVRDYATHSVAEHVFMLMLALRRNLLRYHDAVQNGDWPRAEHFCMHLSSITDLAGSTLGIIGGGSLGTAVARLGQAFGMRVLLAERRHASVLRPGRVAFEQVLREADVLSLHLPLTADNRGMIGALELELMKSTAILINTARGGLVDEAALSAALRAGRLCGAALDVLSQEPPPATHPLLALDLPNLIITPHMAWASRQAQQKLADEVIANIAAFVRGESRNRVE